MTTPSIAVCATFVVRILSLCLSLIALPIPTTFGTTKEPFATALCRFGDPQYRSFFTGTLRKMAIAPRKELAFGDPTGVEQPQFIRTVFLFDPAQLHGLSAVFRTPVRGTAGISRWDFALVRVGGYGYVRGGRKRLTPLAPKGNAAHGYIPHLLHSHRTVTTRFTQSSIVHTFRERFSRRVPIHRIGTTFGNHRRQFLLR